MTITKRSFGTLPDGREASLWTLANDTGLEVDVTDFGATLVSVRQPDRAGKVADVVLGYDSAAEYAAHRAFFGATPGRHANRIHDSRFRLGGRDYAVTPNDGPNQCHGGRVSFGYRLWSGAQDERGVTFTLFSPDGDEGFPGDLIVTVRYSLADDGTLAIDFGAVCNADTLVNLTNHAYFNLAGREAGHAERQLLRIEADFYTPNNSAHLPTGEIRAVADTPMDYRSERPITDHIGADFAALETFGGYDTNFVLRKPERDALALAASLRDPESGRRLCVSTTLPGVQLYTAGGRRKPSPGVCLEAQLFPNSAECTWFPSPVLRAGDRFAHRIEYRFFID